ncbi:MAG TPA: response regulator [Xanthobacteraceae bacterium]|jgi:signal transduction histidine kinase|nr:response regulator [Xanthobacteraceae bacterium]
MGQPLRVLIVEDDERDAALMLRELKRADYEVTFERVETAEAMSAALEGKPWDIVLSDFNMPHFSAPAALALVKERDLDLPFIIISGIVGEEAAVASLRAGARDFLAKGALARLVPAVERERREALARAERKRMREQLLISERMASVGLLAAGVAHELNNPLAILVANLELAAEQLMRMTQSAAAGGIAPAEVAALINDAQEAAERMRLIIRDLGGLSRSNDEEKQGPVELRRVLDSAVRMTGNEVRHRAQLIRDYGDVPLVRGSEAKLAQVFINLIVNAAHAIPEGRAASNEIRIVTHTDANGRAVVEVHDTGAGIPPAVLPRIFDALFTTKTGGAGTGLGLAICHRIITGYGGEISVQSQVGKGTMFRTSLPAALAQATEPAPVAIRSDATRRGRVLVVDDERMLGITIQRILEEHEVTSVTTAREAIKLLHDDGPYDVVLCDLMMPEMTGMDLYRELSQQAPAQAKKFVFMTGGAFTGDASRFLADNANPTIEKPLKARYLRDLVRELLQ